MVRKVRQQITRIILALVLSGLSSGAWGYDLGYGGRLTADDGSPIPGPVDMVFHFYKGETNPTFTLSIPARSVPLVDGIFQVSLSLTPGQLDQVFGDGSEKVYIEVEALGKRYPKQSFMYVPLALKVPVDDDTIMFQDGKLKVGTIGTSQVHGLMTALSLKADAATLSAGLSGKANVSHTHSAADITDLLMATPVLIAGSQDDTATASGGVVRAPNRSGEDVTGPDLTIAAGNGTGTGGSGNIQFLTAASGEVGNAAGTMMPRVTIDKSGNLGIGTTAPSATLEILSTISNSPRGIMSSYFTNDNNGPQIVFRKAQGTPASPIAVISGNFLGNLYTNSYDGSTYSNGAMIRFLAAEDWTTTNHGTHTLFENAGLGNQSPVERMRITASGNVGIGSTTPTQRLDVAGTIRSSSGGFMFPDGSTMTSALPTPSSGYSSTTDLNMAADFGGNGTGNMVLSTRGTERLRITNAGNIGIGSTTPGAKMDVVSGGNVTGLRVLSGSASNWTGYALGRTSTEATFGIATSATPLATGALAGDVVLRTETTSQRLMLGSGTGAPLATIGNGGVAIGTYAASDTPPAGGLLVSGAVGVGTNAPSQALEVAGTIKSSVGGFMFPDGSVMTTAATAGTSGTASTTDLSLVADSESSGVGDVILSSRGAERMRIVNSGNVGIGTSSPGDRLMIRSTKDSTVTPQLPGLAVSDSSLANAGVGGGIALWGNYTGTTPIAGATIHAMKNVSTQGDTGFNLAFHTRVNAGNLTEKMRITSTGNVGIGTVAPSANLMVRGVGGTVPIGTFSDGTTFMNIHVGYKTRSAMSGWVTLDPNGGTSTTGIGIWDALHIDGTTTTTGNVGIGTTSPTSALDVNGVVKASGGFMFPDGTLMTTAGSGGSSPSGGTSSDTDLNLSAGTGVISMETAGAERLRVNNDGNVGIGTITPSSKLDVSGSARIGGGYGSTSNAAALVIGAGGTTPDAASFSWGNGTGWKAHFGTQIGGVFTPRVTFVDNGNVGIGTTTPTRRLDLSSGAAGSTAESLILRNAGTTTSASTGAGLAFALTNASTSRAAAISAVVSNAATGAADLILSTATDNTTPTEKLRIQAGGFVGIGTTNPANRLSVAGGADFSGSVGIGSNIPARALDVVGVIRASGGIEFPDGSTMTTAAAAGTGTSSTTDLSFVADSDADGSGVISLATRGSERIRVDNGGNIGIGTGTPMSRLSVNGGLAVGSYAGTTTAPTNGILVSGKVGIGVVSPVSNLDVLTSGVGLQTVSRLINNVSAAVNSGAQSVYTANRTTSGGTDIAAVGGIITDIASSAYKGALILSTANNSAPAERVRIDASGNVGIGTTSPTNMLSVNGAANFVGNVGIGTTAPTEALEVAGRLKLSGANGTIVFADGTTMTTAAATSTGSTSTTDLTFGADSDGDNTGVMTFATKGLERLRVDTSGNIGIGTTVPSSLLTLKTSSSLDGINLVGSSAGSSSPAYSLYDGASERGVFGYAAANGRWSWSANTGDIVLRATQGNLHLQTGSAAATMTLSNGNVGIGTTAPGALLDVSGNRLGSPSLTGAYIGHAGPTFTDSSTAASGTAANMAFHGIASPTLAATSSSVTTTNAFTTYIAGAPKKGTNNTATNAIALGIGTTALAGHVNSYGLLVNAQTGATNNYSAIFQGGNVGIGSATPIHRLDVAGTVRSSAGGFVFPDGSVMTTAITPTSGGTSSTTDLNLAADTEGTGSGAVIVSTGTVERLRVINSGNVGIATSTPVNTLSVNGTSNFTGNVGIGTTSPQASLDVNGSIVIPSFETAGSSQISFRRGYTTNVGIRAKAISSTNSDGLELLGYNGFDFTVNNGADVAMRILGVSSGSAKGFVGIGTTAPGRILDVQGATPQLVLGSTGNAGAVWLRRSIDGSPQGYIGYTSAAESSNLIIQSDGGSGFITFRAAGAERMRLSATGNLGLGVTSPAYKLDVSGDINTSNCIRIAGTQQLGACASDERFKKNVQPIQGALAKLRLMSPVHYEFRTDEFPERHFSNDVESGLIAQDLERVFPHLVVTDDDGYKRVKYGLDLEMQTIAAVKELALENDQLRAEALILKERADKAEAEVARLTSRADQAEVEAQKLKAESAELRAFLCAQYPSASLCAK